MHICKLVPHCGYDVYCCLVQDQTWRLTGSPSTPSVLLPHFTGSEAVVPPSQTDVVVENRSTPALLYDICNTNAVEQEDYVALASGARSLSPFLALQQYCITIMNESCKRSDQAAQY